MENEDVKAQRISRSFGIYTDELELNWTELDSATTICKGSDTAMKDNAYRISAYGTKRGSQEDTALKEECKKCL